jgi:hypothetical protein
MESGIIYGLAAAMTGEIILVTIGILMNLINPKVRLYLSKINP